MPVVEPAMKIGVSETIQASSYRGRGGKVFCITRSRHGSPPASIRDMTDDDRSIENLEYNLQSLHQNLDSQVRYFVVLTCH